MRAALAVPSLGGPSLDACLDAVARLDPPPAAIVVVLSGPCAATRTIPRGMRRVVSEARLGFAAAVNLGLAALPAGLDAAAILNDDALPAPDWLGALLGALAADPKLAAVQGTVSNRDGDRIDGRGIMFSRYGLPTQVDRGEAVDREGSSPRPIVGVSGTAAVLRREALAASTLPAGQVFDESFDSYHEDVDLGLRLARLGWTAAWVPGAPCRHLGSASGTKLRWRHPWWLLANPWRALAGNLERDCLRRLTPRLIHGELRAAAALGLSNPRAPLVAAAVLASVPRLVAQGRRRETPGPRLAELPDRLRL